MSLGMLDVMVVIADPTPVARTIVGIIMRMMPFLSWDKGKQQGPHSDTNTLQESILMDFVPVERRGVWKSLDSVAAFGWCGSASLGGWLSDRYGYKCIFLLTALVQIIGIAVWSMLLPLVPRKEGMEYRRDEDEGRSLRKSFIRKSSDSEEDDEIC